MSARTEASPTPWPGAPERALPIGTRLDDCEIEQVLAQSSLAVVYRAYDHALRLQVAIKEYMPDALALRSGTIQVVLRARLGAERFERGLRAFIGEAQTLARFEHPSLLRVDRILQRNGTAYRVMRHSPGPTLLEHRRALARSPSATTLRAWFDALLGALEVLHHEGWMHASVTPGNILLLQDGRLLLMDFGAVRAAVIDDSVQDMLAALEPSFEPVEQRDATAGLTQGPWTDLYSLAATLRFCISGKLPAGPASESPNGDWQGLRGDSSSLGGRLVAALEACLAEAPQDRPQSVAQVRALLDRPGAAGAGTEPAAASASAQSLAAAAPPADTAATSTAPGEAEPLAVPAPDPKPNATQDAMVASAADAARAKVIADLEQTFARIDAQAEEVARPAALPAAHLPAAAAAVATVAAAVPPQPQLESVPGPKRRRWPLGGAALALVALLVGAWLLWAGPERGGSERPAESAPTMDRASAAPTPAPALAAVAPAALPAPVPSPTLAEPAPSAAPATAPAPGAAPSSKQAAEPATKSKAKSAAAPSSTRTAAAATPGPRAQCVKRSGYALYQCMQTECAKRSFSKHPECQRLRKDQRL